MVRTQRQVKQSVPIEAEVEQSYLQYAMSTFTRGIPSVIDGLKISQRRVIQSGFNLNLTPDKPFSKVTRWSGNTGGTLHPHGDCSSVVINMANKADYHKPLVIGHGNLGGVNDDGIRISSDEPAAARYLEAKLSDFAIDVFDIPLKYLRTKPNYDNRLKEVIEYVPALPLALVNQQQGLSPGYATKTVAYLLDDILKMITDPYTKVWPDFTSHGHLIDNHSQLDNLHTEGKKAKIDLKGTYYLEDYVMTNIRRNKNRRAIVVTHIPTGSAEDFTDQLRVGLDKGTIQDIADVQDMSSGEGILVRIILKYNADEKLVLGQILKNTNLTYTFPVNTTLVINLLPRTFTPQEIIQAWMSERRKTLKLMWEDLISLEERDILRIEGLLVVLDNIDRAISIIRGARNRENAINSLMNKFQLKKDQAEHILSLQLSTLVGMSKTKLKTKITAKKARIKELKSFMKDPDKQIIAKVKQLVEKHGVKRRTKIITSASQGSAPTKREQFIKRSKLEYTLTIRLFRGINGKRIRKGCKLRGHTVDSAHDLLTKTLNNFYSKNPTPVALNKICDKLGIEKPNSTRKINGCLRHRKRLENHIANVILKATP